MPSTFAAAKTSAGDGTGSVVPLPSGFTNDCGREEGVA